MYIACSAGGRRRCFGGCVEEEAASAGLGPRQTGWSSRGATRQDRDAQTQAQSALRAVVAATLFECQERQGDETHSIFGDFFREIYDENIFFA